MLAVAMMEKGYRKVGINLMFVRYVIACVAFGRIPGGYGTDHEPCRMDRSSGGGDFVVS